MDSNFQWTDELVKEYISKFGVSQFHSSFERTLNEFKKSKEIPKNDFEILSFHGIKNGNFEWHLGEDGKYEGYSLQRILDVYGNPDYDSVANGRIAIHSVKRLSDGEIFNVGDLTNYGYINSFIVYENGSMQVRCTGVNGTDHAIQNLKNIYKQSEPKVPLFTTEDGVEIFDKDALIYIVNPDNFENWISNGATCTQSPFLKYFSSREKRLEYVFNHKPIEVNYKELLEYIISVQDKCWDESMKDFFKSKINA